MSYKAKLNGRTFFDSGIESDKYTLTSARVITPESFTYIIPPSNKKYNDFHELVDFVDVYKEDELIFSGRVISQTKVLDTQKRIKCEHVIAVLNDSVLFPQKFEDTTCKEVFIAMIENHNNQVDDAKKLRIGRITVTDAACYRDFDKIGKTLSRLNDLTAAYGGRIVVRREPEGLYVDWLEDYDNGVNQVIDFGQNLLDINVVKDATDIVTVLVPLGAEDDEGKRLTIESVNSGKSWIEASAANLEKYGRIYGSVIWNDVTTAAALKNKAINYLNAVCQDRYTINVKAIDLKDAGYNVESFKVGQKIKVKSAAHGIDGWFNCVRQELDLLNPENNVLNLGDVKAGYIKRNESANNEQAELINKIAQSYSTKSAMEKAIENATALITGNAGGYVVQHDSDGDGFPDEILVMDTPDINTAVKVWRWNKAGLGYSSTGYNGNFGLAMTMSGQIVADYVATGSLNANLLKSGIIRAQQGDTYWDLNTGLFHLGSDSDTDKSKVFTYIPVTPYYVGDLYVTNKEITTGVVGYALAGKAIAGKTGTLSEGGSIWVCMTSRQSGSFTSDDWSLLTDYMDAGELDALKKRVATAETNITNLPGIMRGEYSAAINTEIVKVNTRITTEIDATNGLIEQKADRTVVEGLQTTQTQLVNRFDSDGGLIELGGFRKEVDEAISEKSKVYRQTPITPYTIGDLWLTTINDEINAFAGNALAGVAIAGWGNDIYTCIRTRAEGAAFNRGDWVRATDYVSEDQLTVAEEKISNAFIDIDVANARIDLKASQEVTNALGTRINEVSLDLDAAKGEISQKVSATDYNRSKIVSMINQNAYAVQIQAQNIDLEGAVTVSSFDSATKKALIKSVTSKSQYYLSTSSSSRTGGSWSDTMPEWTGGKYIWSRLSTTRTYVDGSSDTNTSEPYYDKNLTSALSLATATRTIADEDIKDTVTLFYRSTTNQKPAKPTKNTVIYDSEETGNWSTVLPRPIRDRYYYQCQRHTLGDNSVVFSDVSAITYLQAVANWCSSTNSALIDGGNIAANTVTASQIDVNSLFADSITAGKLTIDGQASSNKFTSADSTRLSNIIMGTANVTQADIDKYDFNGTGGISALDSAVVSKAIRDTNGIYRVDVKIKPESFIQPIVVSDNQNQKTVISPRAVVTPSVVTDRLYLQNPLFKIKTFTQRFTLSGDSASQYWLEDKVRITPDDGYEIIGLGGYYVETDSGKSYCINVYQACIAESGADGQMYFWYGIANTGVTTQSGTIYYYLLEANTKGITDKK